MEEKCKIKINCLCPKGKSGSAMMAFEKYLSAFHKPIESKLIDDSSFYFIYELKNQKELTTWTTNRIPKAVKRIRDTYWLIIHLVTRANKLVSNMNWATERALRWVNNMFEKKTKQNKEEVDKFFKDINLEDKDEFILFLQKDIITWEVIE